MCIPGVGSTGINKRKILLTANGGKMDKYFFTLDLLFRSNWDVSKPASLRSLMKKYLNRDHDVVGGADYIINIYKGDYLNKYTGDAREALMEL